MNLTTVYWVFCISLSVGTVVMAVGLVAIVATVIEKVQNILIARRVRN